MTNNKKDAVNNVRNILEVEPVVHREQLAVFVASGISKEMVGVSLPQDQVKKLTEQDVEKYFKRYKASLSSKMQWLIHFFSSHVKHWLIFSLLMKENF